MLCFILNTGLLMILIFTNRRKRNVLRIWFRILVINWSKRVRPKHGWFRTCSSNLHYLFHTILAHRLQNERGTHRKKISWVLVEYSTVFRFLVICLFNSCLINDFKSCTGYLVWDICFVHKPIWNRCSTILGVSEDFASLFCIALSAAVYTG